MAAWDFHQKIIAFLELEKYLDLPEADSLHTYVIITTMYHMLFPAFSFNAMDLINLNTLKSLYISLSINFLFLLSLFMFLCNSY